MPRVARIVLPGLAHHVTQRGNNRDRIFFSNDDRQLYLTLLAQQAEAHRLRILAYCLMDNHVHLIVIPADERGLAKALGRTHYRYCQHINRTQHRCGHLWQNRFYSCALDREHLWQALAYVELNPVRAGLLRQAWAYPWSSTAAHVGQQPAPAWLDQRFWTGKWTATNWKKILAKQQDKALLERIRLCTHRGRPLAGERMLAKLEGELNRRLRPLPVGRPRKTQEAKQPSGRQQESKKG